MLNYKPDARTHILFNSVLKERSVFLVHHSEMMYVELRQ